MRLPCLGDAIPLHFNADAWCTPDDCWLLLSYPSGVVVPFPGKNIERVPLKASAPWTGRKLGSSPGFSVTPSLLSLPNALKLHKFAYFVNPSLSGATVAVIKMPATLRKGAPRKRFFPLLDIAGVFQSRGFPRSDLAQTTKSPGRCIRHRLVHSHFPYGGKQ